MVDKQKDRWLYFFEGLRGEFSRVSWTEWKELKVYTKVVVSATFVFGMLIYFVDLFIDLFLDSMANIVHLIFG